MRKFSRPKIVVSKCLGFDAVRYNGGIIQSDFVEELKPHVDFISICPEIEMGLKTPREPLNIFSSKNQLTLVQSGTGKDLTRKMASFTDKFFNSVGQIDAFILKSKSPSCALRDAAVFRKDGGEPSTGECPGLFGFGAIDHNPLAILADEARLKNRKFREQFLIRTFNLASLRKIMESGSAKQLREFHNENELLIAAYLPKAFDLLGKLLASIDVKASFLQLIEYQAHFIRIFDKPLNQPAVLGILTSAFDRISRKLSPAARKVCRSSIENYNSRKCSLSEALKILHGHICKAKSEYLMNQTFFQPFPFELV